MEIHGQGTLPAIPDNLSIPQFFLDSHHPTRPLRKDGSPWLIEDQGGQTIGFEELRARTYGLANALSIKWNIRDNDAICIYSPNHTDYPVAVWAIHRLGGIVTPANPSYTTEELVYQLSTTKSCLVFAHPSSLDTALSAARIAGISVDRIVLFDSDAKISLQTTIHQLVILGLSKEPSFSEKQLSQGEAKTKLAFFSFSSGTTGRSKAVAVPHYAVIANVIQMAVHYKINEPKASWEDTRFKPGDVATGLLPFFHIYGLIVNLHFLLYAGMSLVVTSKFNFEQFLKSVVRHRISHLLVVPPQVVLLCKHPIVKQHDLSHVRFLLSGAAPLSGDLVNQLVEILPNCAIGQGYGMTETATTICLFPISQKVGTIGSAGQLIPGVIARVVKEDGLLANYGEQGELVVTGPSMSLGYTNSEEATKETYVNGWIHTGDEVIINENREVFVVDRLKEMMKIRGFSVAPSELEGHLLGHPAVADACVVPIPDEYSGELPMAFVVPHADFIERIKDAKEADDIRVTLVKYVADHKTKYKWLAGGIEFVDCIPKNPSGKILRRVLRERAREMRKHIGTRL
jgi:acyl-CoA synthetase (AMP-forming)/AMP-acid ligase II